MKETKGRGIIMRKETIFKIILVLMVGIILFAMSAKVFAVTDDAIDFNDWNDWEDQGDKSNIGGEQKPNTETPTTPTPTPTTPTTPTTPEAPKKENTDIPKAGLAENTMVGVAIIVLGLTAIYAYKKINEYKNI